MRGIDKPFAFLMKIGFQRQTASNFANDRVFQVKITHLEMLCRALNCTPNDLFEWKPDGKSLTAENHSLQSLQKNRDVPQLSQMVKDIPLEKLDRLEAIIKELNNQE